MGIAEVVLSVADGLNPSYDWLNSHTSNGSHRLKFIIALVNSEHDALEGY